MSELKIIQTDDGSSSIYLPEMNETYHSTKGAITESKYVFLEKGLKHYQSQHPEKEKIRILEVGFGTGLNVGLTALLAHDSKLKIQFTSIEKYPVEEAIINQLNYFEMDSHKDAKLLFDKIHQCEWEKYELINEGFSIKKCKLDVHDFAVESESFDLIYFDAFAPSKQPDIWDKSLLINMFRFLTFGGIIVTYCAQGQFKRDLRDVGFYVEVLDGPPGKIQMTRGTKVGIA